MTSVKANAALKEFRLLSSTIRQLEGSTDTDDGLDQFLGELPQRLANIERLEADGFIPPLERPSGPDVAQGDDDDLSADTP